MVTTATQTANRTSHRFISTARTPRKSFMDKLTPEDTTVLHRFLYEPLDCVHLAKFSLARADREFFGKQAAPKQSAKSKKNGQARSNRQKTTPVAKVHDAANERFLFEKYHYTRHRILKVLRQFADKALTAEAAREILLWGGRALDTRCKIIELNMPLVLSMSKRSRLVGLDFNEMISEGNLALIRSVEKFDPSRGFKFSTYACRAILKSFSRVAMRTGRYRGMFPVELTTELERSDFLDRKRESAEEGFVDDLKHILSANLAQLNDVENIVIKERFALGRKSADERYKTLEQVGQIVGVTKERVRQIQNKALQKIKVALEESMVAA